MACARTGPHSMARCVGWPLTCRRARRLTVRLGVARVFRVCALLLALDYLLGAYLGVFSSTEWSFWFTTVFHLVLCAAIVVRASAVDVTSHASITAYYMLVWKLFYIEYIALPFFVR